MVADNKRKYNPRDDEPERHRRKERLDRETLEGLGKAWRNIPKKTLEQIERLLNEDQK